MSNPVAEYEIDPQSKIPLCLFGKQSDQLGDAILEWIVKEETVAQILGQELLEKHPLQHIRELMSSDFLARVLVHLAQRRMILGFDNQDYGDTFESMIAMIYVVYGGFRGKGIEKAREFIFAQFDAALKERVNREGISDGMVGLVRRAAEKYTPSRKESRQEFRPIGESHLSDLSGRQVRSEMRQMKVNEVGRENVRQKITSHIRRPYVPHLSQFSKSTIVVDYRDVSHNFSEMQIKELLFWILKGGKSTRILMLNVDPTEPLGKLFLQQAAKSKGRFSVIREGENFEQNPIVRRIKGFSGTVISLSSFLFKDGSQAVELMRTVPSIQAIQLVHRSARAGVLAQGIRDQEDLIKGADWMPKHFDKDDQGRFFIREGYESVMRGWEAKINQRIAFAFERAA